MKHLILILSMSLAVLMPFTAKAADIWIAPEGSDLNDGSQYNPLATLNGALRKARELRRLNSESVKGGIRIYMKGGTYFLSETLLLRPEDSGTKDSPTIVCAAPDEKPILSGGIKIDGWKKVDCKIVGLQESVKDKVFVADVQCFSGRRPDFRQVWVNGKKAELASNTDENHMLRIRGVDCTNNTIRIPLIDCLINGKQSSTELFIHQMWETALIRVESVNIKGDEAVLSFRQPDKKLEFEHPWPPPVISEKGNSAFRLVNSIEFLDRPGEWYHDKMTGKLYYYPRADEDMKTAEVIVPVLETLVNIQGTPERPVEDIQWKDITFSNSTWTRPSEKGYVPLQAGMYLLDAYKLKVPGTPDKASLENQAWIGRQPAAVELSNVRGTVFESCCFEHCGASGLDYQCGSDGDRVEGCHFHDIAGSAFVIGKFSDPGIETHLPYCPKDEREVSRNIVIRNNLIHDAANEYWGCAGILAGYVRDVTIEHNELYDLSYSGISVGWGWTATVNCMRNNTVSCNLVHHFGKHNYSCGGIYTLSAQPGTTISGNCIMDICKPEYVHDVNAGYYIYLDEASSYITVSDNWCTEAKFGANKNGMTIWRNNGPEVSEEIKDNAGIMPEFEKNFAQVRNSEND